MNRKVGPTTTPAIDTKLIKQRIAGLHKASSQLRAIAMEPIPPELGSEYAEILAKYTQWLMKISEEMDALVNKWETEQKAWLGLAADKQLAAQQQMQEMNQSFNLQYLGLQQKMQDESRRFTLLSNIMKTRHDTAKNSISNVR